MKFSINKSNQFITSESYLHKMWIVFEYILSLSSTQFVWHVIAYSLLFRLIKFIFSVVWNVGRQLIPLNDILKKYSNSQNLSGQCWAVVTGATDGIGLGFAEVLTKLGFDVCLISRNQQKLNKTVKDLQNYRLPQHSSRKFMTIQFDYSESSDEKKFREMIEKVKKLDIGMLVNNVGTSEIKEYGKFSYEQIKKIINVNCTSMSLMTSELINSLKNRKGKSAIINLSSFAGENAQPYITLYSSTKAMNTFFSEALSLEHPEIDILSVRPMFVESPLSRQKKGFNIPDRRQCAEACLKQIRWGYETNGYILHRISAEFTRLFVPSFVHRFLSKKIVLSTIAKYE